MKRNILALITIWTFLLMGSMAYAASGEYSIDGVSKGAYSHIDIDSNGAINIITSTAPIPGNTNKIVVQVNTNYINGKIAGITGVKINLTGGATGSGTTSTSGSYTFSGLPDGTYDVTVTPTHANYVSFTPTPVSGTVSFIGANQTQNITFNGVPLNTYSIVGNVKTLLAGSLPSVVMELKYGSTVLDNTDKPDTTSGNYAITDLPDGVKYTVTPILSGKTFEPAFTNVTLSGQNSSPVNFIEVAPPTIGQFTAAIKGAYLCNKQIMNLNGTPTSFGYGFKRNLNPGEPSIARGTKAYFLIDSDWVNPILTKFKVHWINYDQLIGGFKVNVYAIDANDNGTLVGSGGGNGDVYIYRTADKNLVEVDATGASSNVSLSVFWP